MNGINLGGVSPMGRRATSRWRRKTNAVFKRPDRWSGVRQPVDFFDSGGPAGGGGGGDIVDGGGGGGFGGGGHHGGHGGWWGGWGGGGWGWGPWWNNWGGYPLGGYWGGYPGYAWSSGYGYPYATPFAYTRQTYSQTVPAACCYDAQTGTLYCPGSDYDGAPAFAEATRNYQGRPMSYVTSPRLAEAKWFWNCPTDAEPSAILNRAQNRWPRMPTLPRGYGPRFNRLR